MEGRCENVIMGERCDKGRKTERLNESFVNIQGALYGAELTNDSCTDRTVHGPVCSLVRVAAAQITDTRLVEADLVNTEIAAT